MRLLLLLLLLPPRFIKSLLSSSSCCPSSGTWRDPREDPDSDVGPAKRRQHQRRFFAACHFAAVHRGRRQVSCDLAVIPVTPFRHVSGLYFDRERVVFRVKREDLGPACSRRAVKRHCFGRHQRIIPSIVGTNLVVDGFRSDWHILGVILHDCEMLFRV